MANKRVSKTAPVDAVRAVIDFYDDEPPLYFVCDFSIPDEHQRKGHGTRLFWEHVATIPKNYHRIELDSVAPSDDQPPPNRFWESLGFVRKNRNDPQRLVLGINGHKTPKPA